MIGLTLSVTYSNCQVRAPPLEPPPAGSAFLDALVGVLADSWIRKFDSPIRSIGNSFRGIHEVARSSRNPRSRRVAGLRERHLLSNMSRATKMTSNSIMAVLGQVFRSLGLLVAPGTPEGGPGGRSPLAGVWGRAPSSMGVWEGLHPQKAFFPNMFAKD